MNQLIYTDPSLSPLPQRVGWAMFTAFFWMMWVYLWLPLITIGLWALGINSVFTQLEPNARREFAELGRLVPWYALVVLIMGGALLLWARLEFMRFHNVSRRSQPHAVPVNELADYTGHSADEVNSWHGARRMIAHHDMHGHLLKVDLLD